MIIIYIYMYLDNIYIYIIYNNNADHDDNLTNCNSYWSRGSTKNVKEDRAQTTREMEDMETKFPCG